jgi:hypothetical protein
VPKWPTVTSQFKSLTSCFIRTRQIVLHMGISTLFDYYRHFPDCGGRRRSNYLFGVRTALSRRPDRALCSCFGKKPNRDLDRKLASTAVIQSRDWTWKWANTTYRWSEMAIRFPIQFTKSQPDGEEVPPQCLKPRIVSWGNQSVVIRRFHNNQLLEDTITQYAKVV